jgi:hypothetical protein
MTFLGLEGLLMSMALLVLPFLILYLLFVFFCRPIKGCRSKKQKVSGHAAAGFSCSK